MQITTVSVREKGLAFEGAPGCADASGIYAVTCIYNHVMDDSLSTFRCAAVWASRHAS